MRRAVAAATRVLCVSATTAADLTERLGVPADRVDVTPLGTDLRPASAEQVAALRRRLGLDGPYLLGLGTVEPRKDLPLVRAFAARPPTCPGLVLAGLAGWGGRQRRVAASGVADRISVPAVPEADKAALLTGADVFAYPQPLRGLRPSGARGAGLRHPGGHHHRGLAAEVAGAPPP